MYWVTENLVALRHTMRAYMLGSQKKFGAGASSLKLLNLVIVDQTIWSEVGI